jgi:Na+/melibiose symporter-like transporter
MVSIILTVLAIIGIAGKDREEYFGVGGRQKKVKIKEYIDILKQNNELKRLMIAGAGTKLAFAIATNMTVLCMLYGAMMNNYSGLYLPMMIIGYVFSAPFFVLTVRTSQKHGQKASLVRYTRLALIMYVGVLALLITWKQGVASVNLSLITDEKLSINLYTILFIIFFGIGYGAYYATADMPIPMVADCSDYETYRSGRYIPGIMGTLFSLVDKLVSALGSTIVGASVAAIGLSKLPDNTTPYHEGMHMVVIILFCIVPMIAWIATLWAMKGYTLTGNRMKEIQDINGKRKIAISEGMSVEDAMETFK